MTSRRSFFQIISAALAVAPAVPALVVTRAIAPAALLLPAPAALPLVSMSVSELVHSSMRMLGVLCPGETLAAQEMKACLVVLRMLHPQLQPDRELILTGNRLTWLRYELAAEMAPEFGIWNFRERCER